MSTIKMTGITTDNGVVRFKEPVYIEILKSDKIYRAQFPQLCIFVSADSDIGVMRKINEEFLWRLRSLGSNNLDDPSDYNYIILKNLESMIDLSQYKERR